MDDAEAIEAIVLAGGKGTRLGALTEDTPKPLLKVGKKPFLEYVLAFSKKERVSRVILATGYLHQEIQRYFGAHYQKLLLTYTIEKELLGTGGAIKLALGQVHTNTVLVLNGDTFFPVPISELMSFHNTHSADITIALEPARDEFRYGRVVLEDSRITRFAEKDKAAGDYINAGVYVVSRDVVHARMPEGEFSFERDFLPANLKKLKVYGFPWTGYFIDIGISDDYQKAQFELASFS